ncbi:MAG: 3-hydroxybutyryl-CoA dehydrogenase [Acidobacteria bacterium]|nr:3-hydroxybutyryl-CoA dehydrogenase [Acidobacteriota bacterium]
MTIRSVGIVGCGLMGGGIAQVCALADYTTLVREVSDTALERGLSRIYNQVEQSVAKGKLSGDALDRMHSRLTGTTTLEGFDTSDLVIEAIVENLADKVQLYADLELVVPTHTILVSNTSSLGITQLAAATGRPDRFAGLHFFNPVPAMKLVEVIRALSTSDETADAVCAFARTVGKEPVDAADRSGFIVNRLSIPYLLDAIREYEAGFGTREAIDTAMKLGCGHPMGPLTLADFIGLDTTYYIANIMFEEFREPRFAPPPLLRRMVLAGTLGRKTGRGFYEYPTA